MVSNNCQQPLYVYLFAAILFLDTPNEGGTSGHFFLSVSLLNNTIFNPKREPRESIVIKWRYDCVLLIISVVSNS